MVQFRGSIGTFHRRRLEVRVLPPQLPSRYFALGRPSVVVVGPFPVSDPQPHSSAFGTCDAGGVLIGAGIGLAVGATAGYLITIHREGTAEEWARDDFATRLGPYRPETDRSEDRATA